MSDNKSNLEFSYEHIGDKVIAEVVQRAALQVKGMQGFSIRFYDEVVEGLSERFHLKRFPGITIKRKKGLAIHLYIIVSLERNFIELAHEMRTTITNALMLMLNVKPLRINIKIEGINYNSKGDNIDGEKLLL